MNRREWLRSWQALLAALGGLVALPAAGYWWRSSHTRPPATPRWLDLGPASKIEEEAWQRRTLSFEALDRWRRDTQEEVVYVRRGDGGIEALSAVCPHNGCLVRSSGAGFTCPCHRSSFDAEGRRVEGPSPRALDRIECRTERGRAFVRQQRFRPGLARPEPIDG